MAKRKVELTAEEIAEQDATWDRLEAWARDADAYEPEVRTGEDEIEYADES